ncbi:iron chelate uptake ABC transporter family permease subunit [Streptomyces flavofungini]|uniref:iron chelate uptake ABC transporter family permease subunit n=1 Tax=Streptomyces flavofungini TaxID=68200 RepID=UPI00199D1553|nr:iron chelate uptake ABC transporter family permease subunit [Streptomyces flavofungini]GHC80969.1 hypothetical protein GCM10010349_63810 [Streptomyces flavofungini]
MTGTAALTPAPESDQGEEERGAGRNSYLLTRSSLNNAQSAHVWLVGTLNGRGWSSVRMMALALLVLLPAAVLLGR